MNLINTNYAFAKEPSFAAQLNFQNNRTKTFTDKQITSIGEQVKKIGTDADTVDIKVGETYWVQDGTPFDDLPSYEKCKIDIKSTLGGKAAARTITGYVGNYVGKIQGRLNTYLHFLQNKASVPAESLPGQIAALRQKLDEAKSREDKLSHEVSAAKKAYEAAIAKKDAAHNEALGIEGDIHRLQDRLEKYS